MTEFFFAAASFFGAFLLFVMQPMTAKALLPWFGGTPLVWTVCMMFFQGVLLLGYLYAHLLCTRIPRRAAPALHVFVVGVGAFFTRLLPTPDLAPVGDASPLLGLLHILAVRVGLPFFVLSATSPLVQAWFHRCAAGKSPYRLYAVSNIGSIGAVALYPFVIEPLLPLGAQERLFQIGYWVFSSVLLGAAVLVFRARSDETALDVAPHLDDGDREGGRPWEWVFLSAAGVMLLLATTEQISRNLAVSSVFWMLPLCLYLLSFVVCFRKESTVLRSVRPFLLPVAAILVGVQLFVGHRFPVPVQWMIYLVTLFIGCLVCHGVLFDARPAAKRLTSFYLFISFGGAIGGIFVGAVAPRVFPLMWEYPLSWAGLAVFLVLRETRASDTAFMPAEKKRALGALSLAALVAVTCLLTDVLVNRRDASVSVRSFFGRLAIYKSSKYMCLYHGVIRHGCQWRDPERRMQPTTYFGPASGIGVSVRALREARKDTANSGLDIGVVGLGVGTSAAWGRAGDRIRFFEIDEKVKELAERYFTYLAKTEAAVDTVIGDGRLSLEREAEAKNVPKYDLLVIDAFSGDAIPLHLLTEEAFALYRSRIKSSGVLAMHVSNRFLKLAPLVFGLAQKADMQAMLIDTDDVLEDLVYGSTWVVMTDDPRTESLVRALARVQPPPTKTVVFTDRFSNLIDLL